MFSYRADAPPVERQREQRQSDAGVFSISDLVRVALESGIVEADNVKFGGVPLGSEATRESEGEAA